MFLHLHSIYPLIHEASLWFVSGIASYNVGTGELFINHNSSAEQLETKQHNSILHQFRKLETTHCLSPLDIATISSVGYILKNVHNRTYSVIFSKRHVPTSNNRKLVIDNFLQLHELSKRYSRRKMRLCKAVFGAVTEKNLSVLVTSKSETIH